MSKMGDMYLMVEEVVDIMDINGGHVAEAIDAVRNMNALTDGEYRNLVKFTNDYLKEHKK